MLCPSLAPKGERTSAAMDCSVCGGAMSSNAVFSPHTQLDSGALVSGFLVDTGTGTGTAGSEGAEALLVGLQEMKDFLLVVVVVVVVGATAEVPSRTSGADGALVNRAVAGAKAGTALFEYLRTGADNTIDIK